MSVTLAPSWRVLQWISATAFAGLVVGGSVHSVLTTGRLPDVQTGYNGAVSALTNSGGVTVKQLRRALDITVNERHVQRYNLAVALRDSGNSNAAIHELRQVVSERPDYALAQRDLGMLLLSSPLTKVRAAALKHLKLAVQADPTDGAAWFVMGNALGREAQWTPAVQAYSRALELGFVRPSVHHNMATGLRYLGAIEDAQMHYRAALVIDPEYVRSRRALAEIQAQTSTNSSRLIKTDETDD